MQIVSVNFCSYTFLHIYVCIATIVSYSYLRKVFCAQTCRGFSAPLAHGPLLVSELFLEYHPLERLLGILGIYFLRIGVSLKTKCKNSNIKMGTESNTILITLKKLGKSYGVPSMKWVIFPSS